MSASIEVDAYNRECVSIIIAAGRGQQARRTTALRQAAKRELAKACLAPSVSVAKMALDHGLNANLLRKWIDQHRRQDGKQRAIPAVQPLAPGAFIPVMQLDSVAAPAIVPLRLHTRLPNAIEIDLDGITLQLLPLLLELLSELPCSVSTPAGKSTCTGIRSMAARASMVWPP